MLGGPDCEGPPQRRHRMGRDILVERVLVGEIVCKSKFRARLRARPYAVYHRQNFGVRHVRTFGPGDVSSPRQRGGPAPAGAHSKCWLLKLAS